MSQYYANFLQTLNDNNIKYIILGSHALYLLNKKHNLGIDVDIAQKDLDILIDTSCADFIKENFISKTIQKKLINKFRAVYNEDRKHKIDVLLSIPRRNMIIDDATILGADYNSLINYSYKDILYEVETDTVTIEAYYGLIKNLGLFKHKHIIEKILQKMPELKERIRA